MPALSQRSYGKAHRDGGAAVSSFSPPEIGIIVKSHAVLWTRKTTSTSVIQQAGGGGGEETGGRGYRLGSKHFAISIMYNRCIPSW